MYAGSRPRALLCADEQVGLMSNALGVLACLQELHASAAWPFDSLSWCQAEQPRAGPRTPDNGQW